MLALIRNKTIPSLLYNFFHGTRLTFNNVAMFCFHADKLLWPLSTYTFHGINKLKFMTSIPLYSIKSHVYGDPSVESSYI